MVNTVSRTKTKNISAQNNYMWNPEMKQCALQDFLNLLSYRAWNYLLRASTTHNGLDHPTSITN